ncbi:MAG TPA: alpha/beta hydrolase [Spirochaetota bacterium]|nr:alpha/beta hydrolase [Spirochaetota bacterium]HPJ34796.1 alpha/beta hydrolase [Spirochaetota bacterium]
MEEMKMNGISFTAGRWPLETGLHTVIFIHGAAGSKHFWDAQVEGLAGVCNTVAIDLPGHGDSTGSGFDSIGSYADAVENFIREMEIRSFVPCGLSMGGAIALQMLISGGDNCSGGIIVNSGARLKVMPAIFEMIEKNYSGYVSMLPVMGASPKTDKGMLAGIISDAEKSSPAVSAGDFTACNTFNATESLGGINVPLLVLTAEEDKLAPLKLGKFIHENVPGSKYVNITDAGHFSPVEKPEPVNDAMKNFIKGVPQP